MKHLDRVEQQAELVPQACQITRNLLAEYTIVIALGAVAHTHFPEVAEHLSSCAACQAELEELNELVAMAYSGTLVPAIGLARPNLTFLASKPAAPEKPWSLDHLGRLVIQFSEALLSSFHVRSAAGATRGRLVFRYVQEPGSVEDLDVTIEVFADDHTRSSGRVRVAVDVPSRGPLDQSGSRVTIRAGQAVWEGETDDSGWADFAPVPLDTLPQMRVEVVPLRE